MGDRRLAVLDHVYAVVDEATAAVIAASDVLDRFGRFAVRTVQSGDETWTGRYLFGRRTYVKIFGPDDSTNRA